MTEDTEFIEEVAIRQFLNRFLALLEGSAKFTPFEYRAIKTTYALIMLDSRDSFSEAEANKTVHVGFALLKAGALVDFESMIRPIIRNIEPIQDILNLCWESQRAADNKPTIDEKLIGYLEYYKVLFEGMAPRALAPAIAALVATGRLPSKVYRLSEDGKADLAALRELPDHQWAVRKRLTIGLQGHLRNAYSHLNYHVKDNGLIEMWDVNPKTQKISWGPESWNLTQLKTICKELWINVLAMYLSHLIFSVNNRQIIEVGGYYQKFRPKYHERRLQDIERISRLLAEERSFRVISCFVEQGKIDMKLGLKHPAPEQDEEVYMASENFSSRYLRPVRNETVALIEQAIGLLQAIENELDAPVTYKINFIDTKEKDLGSLVADSAFAKSMPIKGSASISEVRRRLQVDSIGDATMNVVMKYPLRPA